MRRPTVLALSLAAALAAAPTVRADDRAVEKLQKDAEKIGKVMEGVRGLQWKSEVKKGIQSRDELKAFVFEEFQKELPDDKVLAMSKAYTLMGFLEPGIDLKKTLIDLYSEQIAGFYNPEKKELFLIEDGGEEQNMVMAHELTHALQDQAYDLFTLQKSITDNDDRSLALTSLIEGDASVAMIGYTLREQGVPMDLKMLPDIGAMMKMSMQMGESLGGGGAKGADALKKAPKVLADNLVFPYMEGAGFAHKLIKRGKGGFGPVDAAFADLPTSSEHILHPEKYFGKERDLPIEVTLPDLSKTMGPGWKQLMKNVMGELNTAILLREKLPASVAEKAAAGWGGDAWQVLEGPDGELVWAWETVWDTVADAEEFHKAYAAFAEKRNAAFPPKGSSSQSITRTDARVTVIEMRGEGGISTALKTALASAALQKGYGASSVAARDPFAGLKRPEGWTAKKLDPESKEQPFAFVWTSPEGLEVTGLVCEAAERDGAKAAEAAAKELRASLDAGKLEGKVQVQKRNVKGAMAGRIQYVYEGQRHLQYYMVQGEKQYVLEVTGRPEALRKGFLAFRTANPDLIPEDEGPARPGSKHEGDEAGKKKEPTLF